jgi:tetratricopeptide (TPR) repeat protein
LAAAKLIGRILTACLGLVLSAVGGLALANAYVPDHATVVLARDFALRLLMALAAGPLPGVPGDLPAHMDPFLSNGLVRYALAPGGLLLTIAALLPGHRPPPPPEKQPEQVRESETTLPVVAKVQKKAAKQAAALAKAGRHAEAADHCFANGLFEQAAKYFIESGDFERAAEIRHDQNLFVESAELYLKAGKCESAGSIFGQQGEFRRSAEAYRQAGNLSVAAEMYEKARDFRRAADAYAESGFPREAAKAYATCEQWEKAALCLEEVIREEAAGVRGDTARAADLRKLVTMAGNLYERAELPDRAQAILEKGGCFAPAAEIALRAGREAAAAELFLKAGKCESAGSIFGQQGEFRRSAEAYRLAGNLSVAAELFLKAKEVPRAADVLRRLGRNEEAARYLAEYHRDRGEEELAAKHFEEAGELLSAADIYRLLEQHGKAGEVYERFGDGMQAAEMFALAGDRARAAANYERAGMYSEAAECHALAGESEREADLLTKAGEYLRAGEILAANGRTDDAIKALQEVTPEHADFPAASALLGEIFRERGMLPLAIKKLQNATTNQDISRGNVKAFYGLALCYEASDEAREATELYEKILAFDYNYADVSERVERTRKAAEAQNAQSAATPLSGSGKQGRYEIIGKLGRGGMGIVYKARDTVLDRTVAFKVLPETLKESPQALKNFLREAKSAAALNHPNIVTVYDAGEQDGVYYIAMEYVDGNTLKEIVKRRGKISAGGIVHVFAQLCEALAYAHEKKIVHRDIKTANAMWTRDRKAKIMDFGLAKVIEEVRNHTTVVSGTPYYMSPEQTLGKNIDHRTDIYSLGVTIFEMATGTLPFTEGNLPYHHVHTPPPDPREFTPDLPAKLAEIVLRCMEKDPANRFQSTTEILAELKSTLTA